MKAEEFKVYLSEFNCIEEDFCITFVLTDCRDGVNDNECYITPDKYLIEDDKIILYEKNPYNCFKKVHFNELMENFSKKDLYIMDKKRRLYSIDFNITPIFDFSNIIFDVPLFNYCGNSCIKYEGA
ncbi:hypothetical protein OF820_06875 [Oceanotoga sp. DSM 15011]|jgi:hypothetical protein|uniref:Uncharacterized protein n=1 Tax=Oceanotoga teriensis TaxID=515440 RepID=A0AA45C5N4_9BACT|nr:MULTISPECIES: hypothetical protein [Oceanotoga]MDN5343433.1 tRNA (adenine57-N1/adenine58-N1)-methyltransferase catalytic subunit [Oceanotoga sp.]MDO7976416.1 hypothetical protein [Oceanotoga teriensis]PWJ89044.1 hypothetical protein C7380_11657 [Oceanotoga teriensis]UYP01408.1 hypothetical protein OF820_06875 [Oceanotoga sp. DSM 15011]